MSGCKVAEAGSEWTAEETVKQLWKSGEVDEKTVCPVSNTERPKQREGGGRMRGERESRKQKSVPRCGCRRDTDWLYPTRPVSGAKLGQREITEIEQRERERMKNFSSSIISLIQKITSHILATIVEYVMIVMSDT